MPATVIVVGFATGMPPNVQFEVVLIVLNCCVRLMEILGQFATILSGPKLGLGLASIFRKAVSVHPNAVLAISLYTLESITIKGVFIGILLALVQKLFKPLLLK